MQNANPKQNEQTGTGQKAGFPQQGNNEGGMPNRQNDQQRNDQQRTDQQRNGQGNQKDATNTPRKDENEKQKSAIRSSEAQVNEGGKPDEKDPQPEPTKASADVVQPKKWSSN
jgi:hypothetical protein